MVNNAGVSVHKKALDITPEDFDRVVRVNSKGVYFCCQAADRLKDPQASKSILESTPLGRVGGPEDIVGLMLFLASKASDYMTGQTIFLDGGRTIL